jgi:hypothetical protein
MKLLKWLISKSLGHSVSVARTMTLGLIVAAGIFIALSTVTNLDGMRWDKAMYDDIRPNAPGRPVPIHINPEEAAKKWLAMPDGFMVSDYEGKTCSYPDFRPAGKGTVTGTRGEDYAANGSHYQDEPSSYECEEF